jgi:hypothetical protein
MGNKMGKVTWYVWNEKEQLLFLFIPKDASGNERYKKYVASINVTFK